MNPPDPSAGPPPAPHPPGPPVPPVQRPSGPSAFGPPISGPPAFGPPDPGAPVPDGPAVGGPGAGSAPAESGRRSSGRGRLAIVVSLLSLLVAVASLLVAWRAVDRANDARDIALTGRGAPQGPAVARDRRDSAPPPPPAGGANQPPVRPPTGPNASGEPPPLNRTTTYPVAYEKQTLTLRPTGSYPMYADLDEPRADVPQNGADIELSGSTPYPLRFKLREETKGSESGATGMTAYDCDEKIRTAPVGSADIPVRQGNVLCIRTSYTAARERGDVARMVLMEVMGITDDRAVTVQLTAWKLPR